MVLRCGIVNNRRMVIVTFLCDHKVNMVLSLPNDADMFTDLDEHLKNSNPGDFLDAESRLLVKLWNDNEDIEEELRERVCDLITCVYFGLFVILCQMRFIAFLRQVGTRLLVTQCVLSIEVIVLLPIFIFVSTCSIDSMRV